MDVGIGLPNSLLGIRGPELVDWSRRAEGAGFSVLGTIGRVVYDTHEELVALAAAAGATDRIELMTTVLVGPPRDGVLLAKQAATLQAVSGGRFRLGLGIGGRDDDWRALGASPSDRGAKLEELVAACRRVWGGTPPDGVDGSVGPRPEPPVPVVLGGFAESAYRRAGRIADGFLAGPMPPEGVAGAYETVVEAASGAGRERPALYAARYVALGDDVADEADENAAAYYAFGGDDTVQMIRDSILRTPDEVEETLAALREIGCEEVCLWPMAGDVSQVDRIAEAALTS